MIKFETCDKELKGERILNSLIPWNSDNCGFNIYDSDINVINLFQDNKVYNKSIKITVGDGEYIRIPNYKNCFFTSSSDDNYSNKELSVHNDKINELYIPVTTDDLNFKEKNKLFKNYIIDVINDRETIIQRYFIYITINYKNNGKRGNLNFDFDYEVVIHKIFEKNITYGLVNYMFLGYLIWIFVMLILSISANSVDIHDIFTSPLLYVVMVSYITYIFVKTRYVGNTYINKAKSIFLQIIKKRKKDYYSMRDVRKILDNQIK